MSQQEMAVSQVSGMIWKILVEPGAAVAEEDILGIVEAMKMEIPILAPCNGIVATIFLGEGEIVEEGQPILAIQPPGRP